ncbi:hypothetical protein J6590_104640 [Homalodisca vitripennis]|nr:hypothetical protein J6590_104640 [Homalodisca vitripennis]
MRCGMKLCLKLQRSQFQFAFLLLQSLESHVSLMCKRCEEFIKIFYIAGICWICEVSDAALRKAKCS